MYTQQFFVLQNSEAFRSILHRSFSLRTNCHTSIDKLHEIAELPRVKERLISLNSNNYKKEVKTNIL